MGITAARCSIPGGRKMAVVLTLVLVTGVAMEANGSPSTLPTSLRETQIMIVRQPLLRQQRQEHQQQQDQLERPQQHRHHRLQQLSRPLLNQLGNALKTAATSSPTRSSFRTSTTCL